jgi:hypothetical protein
MSVQAARVSVLMGALGFVAGWVSTLAWWGSARLLNSELGFLVGPGVCFGLVVLIPFSRWCGRGWWRTLFTPAVSAGAYYAAVMAFVANSPPFGDTNLSQMLGGFVAGGCGAAIVAAWLTPWLWPRPPVLFWTATLLMGGLGGVTTGLAIAQDSSPWWGPPELEELSLLVDGSLIFAPYQTLLAIALGMRLWRSGGE